MSEVRNNDLKTGTFETWAVIEPRRAAAVKAMQVKVDHNAATRQAIIVEIRRKKFEFKTCSDWKAKEPATNPKPDWDYQAIALHHAGNSFGRLRQLTSMHLGISATTTPSIARG